MIESFSQQRHHSWIIFWSFIGFIFMALCGLPQVGAMYFLGIGTFLISFLMPGKSFTLFLLFAPFFLGNSKRSHFFFLEVLLFSALLGLGAAYFINREKSVQVGGQRPFIFILALIALFLTLPMEIRRVIWDLRISPVEESWTSFQRAYEGGGIYPLRLFFSQSMTILLAWALFSSPKSLSMEKESLKVFTLALLMLVVVAFLMRFNLIPHQGKYLGAVLVGRQPIVNGRVAITGFAYNCGYFAQYITLMWGIPLFLFLKYKSPVLWRIVAVITLFTSLLAMVFTYQKGALIALVASFLVCVMIFMAEKVKRPGKLFSYFLIALLSIVSLLLLLDTLLFSSENLSRFLEIGGGDSLRSKIWKVAWEMWKENPFFGIGIGRFHQEFPAFCQKAGIPFEGHLRFVRSTAHNTYFHLLAERGIVGFLGIIGPFFYGLTQILRRTKSFWDETIQICLIFFTTFFLYGCFQYMFYIRSIEIIYWIFMAIFLSNVGQNEALSKAKPSSDKLIKLFILFSLWLTLTRFIYLWIAGAF